MERQQRLRIRKRPAWEQNNGQASGDGDGEVAELCPDSESDIRLPRPQDMMQVPSRFNATEKGDS